MILTEMTWPEIREAAEAGAIAVLPTGSTEQHGKHLPTGTDTTLVESVVRAGCLRVESGSPSNGVVLAPTLWLGASDHHRGFFALSVSEATYISMVADIASSVAEAGFAKLCIINGHGGNTAPIRVALAAVRRSAPDLLVATADYWALAASAMRAIRASGPGGAAHAGEIETSLMLHLSPESVRTDLIARSVPSMPEGFEIDLIDGGAAAVYVPWTAMSADGQVGDPTVADAGRGREFFDAAAEAVAGMLTRFAGLEM